MCSIVTHVTGLIVGIHRLNRFRIFMFHANFTWVVLPCLFRIAWVCWKLDRKCWWPYHDWVVLPHSVVSRYYIIICICLLHIYLTAGSSAAFDSNTWEPHWCSTSSPQDCNMRLGHTLNHWGARIMKLSGLSISIEISKHPRIATLSCCHHRDRNNRHGFHPALTTAWWIHVGAHRAENVFCRDEKVLGFQ